MACPGAAASPLVEPLACAAPADGVTASEPDVLAATAEVGSTAVASGAPDCVPGAGEAGATGGEAAAPSGEAASADSEAAPAGPGPAAAGPTIGVPPPAEGGLASWFACAGTIWLLPPAAEACTAVPSVGAAVVDDGCDAAATGAGGAAAPDTGKFPPPVLPGDGLDCVLLRPGLPDTSFSVPANSELLAADFAGSAVEVSFGAGAFGAGATGVLKAGIDALMR